MYNYFIFFLNVVPDASVDQKYTGKKRKWKGKYPLFIFRISVE